MSEKGEKLIPELKIKILKTAAIYEKQIKDKKFLINNIETYL